MLSVYIYKVYINLLYIYYLTSILYFNIIITSNNINFMRVPYYIINLYIDLLCIYKFII